MNSKKLCAIKTCHSKYYAKGFCQKHYDKSPERQKYNIKRLTLRKCNTYLGYINEDQDILLKAIKYLRGAA